MSTKSWKSYEDVTRQLLTDIRQYLDLERVQGKQKVKGQITGIDWEVDAIGYEVGTEQLVLVECKKRSGSKISQETIGGFAYRIQDTGAERGILVTTIGIQEGAKKVANAAKITEIRLDINSTDENYIAQIANAFFAKLSIKAIGKVDLNYEVKRAK